MHGVVFGGIWPVGSYPGICPTWGWHVVGCKVVQGCVVLSAVHCEVLYSVRCCTVYSAVHCAVCVHCVMICLYFW